MKYFSKFDFKDFWDDSKYSKDNYIEEYPSDELISEIEQELGYKLPQSYIALMKQHNGGIPFKTCYPMTGNTGWEEDHTAITGIMGIGKTKPYSLCGSMGSKFMMEEWGYPDIGIMICDTPTAGHTMIMLDYRKCGNTGEPQVVIVDQENNYSIDVVAKDFETFIMGLKSEDEFLMDF